MTWLAQRVMMMILKVNGVGGLAKAAHGSSQVGPGCWSVQMGVCRLV